MPESATPTATAQPAATALTRADMDAAGKLDHGYVTLSDGRRVYFRSLSESERCRIDGEMYADDGTMDQAKLATRRARLMAAALVDSEGKRLYSDDEWSIVAGLNARLTNPIYRGLAKHLGMAGEETEDTAAKN